METASPIPTVTATATSSSYCKECKGTCRMLRTRVDPGTIDTYYRNTLHYPLGIVPCPYCFGTGKELEWNERMQLYRKQLSQERAQKEREKEMEKAKRKRMREIRREVHRILKSTCFKSKSKGESKNSSKDKDKGKSKGKRKMTNVLRRKLNCTHIVQSNYNLTYYRHCYFNPLNESQNDVLAFKVCGFKLIPN